MNDSENSLGRSIKMILGTLGIFVVFGFLALIFSGFAGHESAEDRAYKGEFGEEVTEARWKNLEEIEQAQTAAVDQAKVDAALKQIGATVSKPAKTAIVVPGSPTFLKQAEAQPAPAGDAAPSAPAPAAAPSDPAPAAAPSDPAPAAAPREEADKKEKPEASATVIKPAPPGTAAPKKETPKPGPVNAPEAEAKGTPKEETKPKAPAQPAPAPAPAPANQ